MVPWSLVTLVGAAFLASSTAAFPSPQRGLIRDLLALEGALDNFLAIDAPTAPTSEIDALSTLERIFSDSSAPTGFIDTAEALLSAGFAPNSLPDLLDVNTTYTQGENSMSNSNPVLPENTIAIYPEAADGDAPYSLSEEDLRQAIYIPDGFTNGSKPPLLMIPGTGQPGYMTYSPNLIPVVQNNDFADPVWLNLPGFLLGDAQISAEYIAYATNYIAALTGQNVTLISYSQGCIITQWALTFWPSIRSVVSDFVALSPAFRGSSLVSVECVAINAVTGCPPAIHQQVLESNFVNAMRNHGGASALVPTTMLFSATDEIAQPQTGDDATALLDDDNSVGVTPVRVQDADVCGGKLAGGVATHEGMMYHPLTLAMLEDAMTHDGPGDLARLDLDSLCELAVSEGMTLDSLVMTEIGLVKAGVTFLEYRPYVEDEPAIASYAA